MPFNIGPGELIIVLIIALIVVGPGRLPDVGASLGKSIREFRKAAADVKESTSMDAPSAPAAPAATQATPPAQTSPARRGLIGTSRARHAARVGIHPGRGPGWARRRRAGPGRRGGPGGRRRPRQAAAPGSEWPAEVTPVDEQQPTPSA